MGSDEAEGREMRDGEFIPDSEVLSAAPEEYQGPIPPQVAVDMRTGQLPFGWSFADD